MENDNGLNIEVGMKIYRIGMNGKIINTYKIVKITKTQIITDSPSVKFRRRFINETGYLSLIHNGIDYSMTSYYLEIPELKERKIKQDLVEYLKNYDYSKLELKKLQELEDIIDII